MVDNPKSIIITPESHWDREWYLTFQGYRAKLVLLMDRLLSILKTNPDYDNFTLDGQTVVIQDYLEVRPEKEKELTKYISEGRISVGPMYILPDEYLVSGEAIIRNLMLGIKISKKFGNVMNCAYIPDPFGHISQLPQILKGFELPVVMFWRGIGNEFINYKLNMEFLWEAPGNSASIIAIDLLRGYGSIAALSENKDKDGNYSEALSRIEEVVNKLNSKSCTGIIPLNNGSDHLFAQEHIPEIVKQWNKLHPNSPMIQADFGEYSKQVLETNPASRLKAYSGELHGGRYCPILSGVFSARMWIKQENAKIQNLFEKYCEPFAALSWFLTGDKYPSANKYIWKAWQELLRNHPHDSICGCSVDEVHDIDMKARFHNAMGMGKEILKESLIQIASNIPINEKIGERYAFLVFNPLPWERTELERIKILSIILRGKDFQNVTSKDLEQYKLIDDENIDYSFIVREKKIEDRYTSLNRSSFELVFFAEKIPALGYKLFYLIQENEPKTLEVIDLGMKSGENWIENEFYKVIINSNGTFKLVDKVLDKEYKNLGLIADKGDWGDEYDFSGPNPDQNQKDSVYTSHDIKADICINSTSLGSEAIIQYDLNLPVTLKSDENRTTRSEKLVKNSVILKVELQPGEKLLRINLKYDNQSKDHRIRMFFPSSIKTDKIRADGHFYVVPRSLKPPDDKEWRQKWVPTHHQNKFVTVNDKISSFTVINKGLPEYEAIKNEEDGTVIFAVTLLRSIEWLSRPDIRDRPGNAGPDLYTPGAQCLGEHHYELALTTAENNWLESDTYRLAECFTSPLQVMVPRSIESSLRIIDAILLYKLSPWGKIKYKKEPTLHTSLSLFSINNPKISLSALKRSEEGNSLIIRLLNLSGKPQNDNIEFYKEIKSVELVNYNEEKPINPIKAKIYHNNNRLSVILEPYVLATVKIILN
ncbi:MAG: glycoside hydrolase family 38 C-terminal domain-containing protein [Promethearchaeota archaeon]